MISILRDLCGYVLKFAIREFFWVKKAFLLKITYRLSSSPQKTFSREKKNIVKEMMIWRHSIFVVNGLSPENTVHNTRIIAINIGLLKLAMQNTCAHLRVIWSDSSNQKSSMQNTCAHLRLIIWRYSSVEILNAKHVCALAINNLKIFECWNSQCKTRARTCD